MVCFSSFLCTLLQILAPFNVVIREGEWFNRIHYPELPVAAWPCSRNVFCAHSSGMLKSIKVYKSLNRDIVWRVFNDYGQVNMFIQLERLTSSSTQLTALICSVDSKRDRTRDRSNRRWERTHRKLWILPNITYVLLFWDITPKIVYWHLWIQNALQWNPYLGSTHPSKKKKKKKSHPCICSWIQNTITDTTGYLQICMLLYSRLSISIKHWTPKSPVNIWEAQEPFFYQQHIISLLNLSIQPI